MVKVEVYTTRHCAHCVRAKLLLHRRDIPFVEIDVSGDHEKRAWLVRATGRRTVPQIFIGGRSIGGAAELAALDRSGELTKLLAGTFAP
jgi:glutaredoxin 3